MSMETAQIGPPDTKRFKLSMPTQVVVHGLLSDEFEESQQDSGCEASAPPSEDSPGVASTTHSPHDEEEKTEPNNASWTDDDPPINTGNLMDLISKSLLGNSFKMDDSTQPCNFLGMSPSPNDEAESPKGTSPAPTSTGPALPGAQVVAQSPVAQLFAQDDWSWHRNPAAAIRSGGTNKQTPVWKYFVYNKAENLSRCIVGDCTYQLKGPHTSTLACHLKKHPAEYAEFQKLKVDYTSSRPQPQPPQIPMPQGVRAPQSEYTRERTATVPQMPPSPSSSASSATSSGGSAGAGALKTEERKPKEKNPQTNKNISNIVDALNRQAAASIQAQNVMTPPNLLGSLSSLLHHPLPPPVSGFPFLLNHALIPTSTNKMNIATQLLQQHNALSAALNGNASSTPNKKWKHDERRQKDLELRLALMISTGHMNPAIVTNPFFREFIEAAQPKFNIPDDVTSVDKLISSEWSRLSATIKTNLSKAKRISVLVDVAEMATKKGEEDAVFVCIAAAYLSASTNKLETALLAVRRAISGERLAANVQECVNKVIAEFELSSDRVTRTLINGADDLRELKSHQPFLPRLATKLTALIDLSPKSGSLRTSFYSVIFALINKPKLLQMVQNITGEPLLLDLSLPFAVMGETLLTAKEEIIQVIQTEDSNIDLPSEEQWDDLDKYVRLYDEIRERLLGQQNGQLQTIDAVIPTLNQLKTSLEANSSNSSIDELIAEVVAVIQEESSHIMDKDKKDFDGSYIEAAALNPYFATTLSTSQLSYAKEAIEKKVCDKIKQIEEINLRRQKFPLAVDSLLANVAERNSNTSDESMLASFLPNLFPDISQKDRGDGNSNSNTAMAKILVDAYFNDVLSKREDGLGSNGMFSAKHLPPLAFWSTVGSQASVLADLALTQLSIPSATLSSQRIFGTNNDTLMMSNDTFDSTKLPPYNSRFERDVLLRFNKVSTQRFTD